MLPDERRLPTHRKRWLVILAVQLSLAGTACAVVSSAGDSPMGHWTGIAAFRGATLPLAITVRRDGDSLTATFSSPQLLLQDQPFTSVEHDPPHIRLEASELDEHVRLEGTLRGDSLAGTLTLREPGSNESARGMTFSLVRTSAPSLPYRTEEVVFENDGARLSGTLFIPSGAGPHPAMVFVHGSSLNARHGYRFYADHFARNGIAALIYDKRGTGQSSGDYRRATIEQLVGDAVSAVRLLRSREGLDTTRVGVWGLSQGGMLAPLIVQRANAAFVIAVSGPGVSLGEAAAYQDSIRVLRAGFPARAAAEAARIHRLLTAWIADASSTPDVSTELARTADLQWRRHTGIPRQAPSAEDRDGWYWASRPQDPVEGWRNVRVPALVIFGDEDVLVPARYSASRIELALRQAGNRSSRVVVYRGADHMMKLPPRQEGGGWRWPRPAPGYLDTMTVWITRQPLPKIEGN
jgi:uncharacterized protein